MVLSTPMQLLPCFPSIAVSQTYEKDITSGSTKRLIKRKTPKDCSMTAGLIAFSPRYLSFSCCQGLGFKGPPVCTDISSFLICRDRFQDRQPRWRFIICLQPMASNMTAKKLTAYLISLRIVLLI